jgi:hypothetical protein
VPAAPDAPTLTGRVSVTTSPIATPHVTTPATPAVATDRSGLTTSTAPAPTGQTGLVPAVTDLLTKTIRADK